MNARRQAVSSALQKRNSAKCVVTGRPTLFITYDGLLDPLGSSQILPYVRGLATDRSMHVLSFEKPDRFVSSGAELRRDLEDSGIGWTPLTFTKGGKLAKLVDLLRMYGTAISLQQRNRFAIVHCRSYLAAQVGFLLKRVFRIKFIFDMRGLWVDERVEGGLWNRGRLFDRLVYLSYKRIERRLLEGADAVVTLTKRSVQELKRLAPAMSAPISVIPCSADFESLSPLSPMQRAQVRQSLGIPEDALVLSYLGSLGTWYQFDEMLAFFAKVHDANPDAWWLMITKDWGQVQEQKITKLGFASLRNRIQVRPAERAEIGELVGASDVMLSFIRPGYSKLASSPIKFGEACAMGIPTISSQGVGDMDDLVMQLHAGITINPASSKNVEQAVQRLPQIIGMRGEGIRNASRALLGLEVALERYRAIYSALEES